jgi:hypothetical protein
MKYMSNYCRFSFLVFVLVVMSLLTQCKGGEDIIPTIEPPIIEKVRKIATTEEVFRSFLGSATPGDTIFVSGTIYVSGGAIKTSKSGVPSAPIFINGLNDGILIFTAPADRACLTVSHNYYRINNLSIDANSQSKRGLLIEEAEHGIVTGVSVLRTLNEAFKIRKNSRFWLFDQCTVLEPGREKKYGEGFYAGDANANWTTGNIADRTGYITFNRCTVYAYADGFDLKEGTHNIKVVNCFVDWQGGDVDKQFGNHGVSTRCDNVQIINCTVKNNTKGVGKCVWAGSLKAKDGIWYGKNVEIKKLTGYNMAQYGYWSSVSATTLYSDYTIEKCAGIKDPTSEVTALVGNPSDFIQMTWTGIGGEIY